MKRLVGLLPLLALAGCCSAPRLDYVLEPRQVSIFSEPAGAAVVQLQPLEQVPIHLGITPLNDITVVVMDQLRMAHLPVPQSQELQGHAGVIVVRVSKPGYRTFEGALRTDGRRLAEHRIVLEPLGGMP